MRSPSAAPAPRRKPPPNAPRRSPGSERQRNLPHDDPLTSCALSFKLLLHRPPPRGVVLPAQRAVQVGQVSRGLGVSWIDLVSAKELALGHRGIVVPQRR